MNKSELTKKETTLANVLRLAAKTGKLYVGSEVFAEIREKTSHSKSALSYVFYGIEVILVNSLEPRAILATKPRG